MTVIDTLGVFIISCVAFDVTSIVNGGYFFVFLVSTKGSDHPVQTQTLRLSCHLCRWSGKQRKHYYFYSFRLSVLLFGLTVSAVLDTGI